MAKYKYKYEFLELHVDSTYSVIIDMQTRVKSLMAGRQLQDTEIRSTFTGMTTIINPDGTPDLATDEEIEYLKSISIEYGSREYIKECKFSSYDTCVIYHYAEY